MRFLFILLFALSTPSLGQKPTLQGGESKCFSTIVVNHSNKVRAFTKNNGGFWYEVVPPVKWRINKGGIVKHVYVPREDLEEVLGRKLFKKVDVDVEVSRYWNFSANPLYDWVNFAGDNLLAHSKKNEKN